MAKIVGVVTTDRENVGGARRSSTRQTGSNCRLSLICWRKYWIRPRMK
nr:hypothetical protein [Cohnella cholangitidis]